MDGNFPIRATSSVSHAVVHLMNQLIKTLIPQSRVLSPSPKLTENRLKINTMFKVISIVDLYA